MSISSKTPTDDPYRDWLQARLSREFGVREAEQFIQGAVQRRGWNAVRVLGPRDVVAVLQDVYQAMLDEFGENRADRWLQEASMDLNSLATTVPEPIDTPEEVLNTPGPKPVAWGRRAHDLPLMLARVHNQIATRSLAAIRTDSELSQLERLKRAAEWDVQATQAEVRRWETEDMLSKLRSQHARAEVTDQVASARAQAELLDLTVRELETMRGERSSPSKLAHNRLMLTQTLSFLDAFAPLVNEAEADEPLTMLDIDLRHARYSLGVPLHPNVLRARYGLNYALWQAGELGERALPVQEAQRVLAQAENEAATQLRSTIEAARTHQNTLKQLAAHVEELEQRASKLSKADGDPISIARVRLEWRQARAAARIQANRLEEAVQLLEALVSDSADTSSLN